MAKYSSEQGDPIDMLVEECAEVIKECMKLRRFGPDGDPVWVANGNKPPKDNVIQEIGDLLEIVDIMLSRNTIGITYEKVLTAQKKKRERLKELFV